MLAKDDYRSVLPEPFDRQRGPGEHDRSAARMWRIKQMRVVYPRTIEAILHRGAQNADAVHDAAAKIDRRCLPEIPGRTGNLTHPETRMQRQGDRLVVECEIVGTMVKRQPLQQGLGSATVAAVIFGHFCMHQDVLGKRQRTLGDEFAQWHAARQGLAAENA